ncbi:hypothetical protein CRM22_000325, partial [Opisthorchis felineus]
SNELNVGPVTPVLVKGLTRERSAPVPLPAVSRRPKSAKSKIPANHLSVINMVKATINAAKDPGPTINYKVDIEKHGPHISRGIVHAAKKDVLIRVGNKGKGTSGAS